MKSEDVWIVSRLLSMPTSSAYLSYDGFHSVTGGQTNPAVDKLLLQKALASSRC